MPHSRGALGELGEVVGRRGLMVEVGTRAQQQVQWLKVKILVFFQRVQVIWGTSDIEYFILERSSTEHTELK